jgi:hypothetical protein
MSSSNEHADPGDWSRWIEEATDDEVLHLYLKTKEEDIGLELENPRGKSVTSEMLEEELERRGLEAPDTEILSDKDLEAPDAV